MEVFPASVALIIPALLVSARWADCSRHSTLEEMTAAAGTSRVAELEARVATLEVPSNCEMRMSRCSSHGVERSIPGNRVRLWSGSGSSG